MRTDGLNAFDEATRAALPRLKEWQGEALRQERLEHRQTHRRQWASLAERNLWIKQEYAAGIYSAEAIGKAVGLTDRMVRAIAGPIRQGHRPENPNARKAAREWKRRQAAGEKVTARQVGAAYGLTKNQVIGAAKRLGKCKPRALR